MLYIAKFLQTERDANPALKRKLVAYLEPAIGEFFESLTPEEHKEMSCVITEMKLEVDSDEAFFNDISKLADDIKAGVASLQKAVSG